MKQQNYIKKIINLFTTNDYTQQTKDEVHHWLVDSSFEKEKESSLKELWDDLIIKSDDITARKSLNMIYKKIGVKQNISIYSKLFIFTRKYAAIFAIFISSLSVFYVTKHVYSSSNAFEYVNSTNEIARVVLPDGSVVETNTNSILFYPTTFNKDTRQVYLIGEASFVVTKNPDQPFVVRAGDISVTALGTEFNISAYPKSEKIRTTLLEGSVNVDFPGSPDGLILSPGEQLVYNVYTKKTDLIDVDAERVVLWKQGQILFNTEEMKEILISLERIYRVTFLYDEQLFNDDKYSFRFKKSANIIEVLDVLKEVSGIFDYKIDGENYYLIKK